MRMVFTRRHWIRTSMLSAGFFMLPEFLKAERRSPCFIYSNPELNKSAFGIDFAWGVACASYQVEGRAGGKGEDIWDRFSHTPGNIKTGENGDLAADFYHLYKNDISLIKEMNFSAFRFSIAWARIFPAGTGAVNPEGVAFYHKVIDACHELGITPWVTLFHWDLPQALEVKGGWINRGVLDWFSDYVDFCTKEYGSKVKNWMVLNEPMAFTGLGYMTGDMAPGRKGLGNFLAAAHHATLCQAEGGRIIRKNVPGASIGTTFSCTWVDPVDEHPANVRAARRVDAINNRFFIEPALGLGYPLDDIPALKRIEKYMLPGDSEKMKFDFDFIGVQNYFRTVVKHSFFPPFLWAKEIPAKERGVPANEMDGEVSPDGFYKILKQFGGYTGVKNIIVTENGACFKDVLNNGRIHDTERVKYFEDYLAAMLKAKQEGVKIGGYFVWSLTDNFEWAEGFRPRFGLVYVDFKTQQRTIKDSGYWFRDFLK